MPFREKVKKAFGKSSEDPSETNSEVSQIQSKGTTKKPKKQKIDYPENVYKPGEIPESKYKGPYNKAHQQKLHAFSFGTAFQGRRKSEQSLYSPMGSRLPSRQSRVDDVLMEKNEADDEVEKAGNPRQYTKEEDQRLRNGDAARPRTGDSQRSNKRDMFGESKGNTRSGFGNRIAEQNQTINGFGHDDFDDSNRMDGLESTKTLLNEDHGQASFGQPFSADDLVRAMTQSTLKPAAVQA
ncbi:MAG: hypothetical protein Q9219_005279 [cf. Caloplaca sp. 3 TL-2023]